MGTSVGPFDAIAGLLSGVTEGRDLAQQRARQKQLDAEKKTEADRAFGLDKAAQSLARAKTITEEGLIPDTGRLAPGDVQPSDFVPRPLPQNVAGGMEAGPFGALLGAFERTKAQPRVSIMDPSGQSETFRQGVPLRIQQERETQTGIDARAREKEAADLARATAGEAGKAADAAKKEQDTNTEAFGTFQALYPTNQFAKAYNPKMNYKALMDRLDKLADRDLASADRKAAVAIAHADREAALGDRKQARAEKGTGATKQLPAPLAARVGQFGEMLKKSADLMPMVDDMDVTLGKSASRDLAEGGVHVPFFGTVPGTKGLGERLMSKNPAYAQYQAALQPFILAAAHAMSGARINPDQTEKIRKSIELAPGDFHNPNVRKQKQKNMIDLINSIAGSLPAGGVEDQEVQMDDAEMEKVVGRGYKRRGAATAKTATSGGDKISADDFANLSPSAQAYFRSVGRAP